MIIGALTKAGNVAPIELEASENGNVWLGRGHAPVREVRCRTLTGPLLEAAREEGITLHVNHFATCGQAELFGRGANASDRLRTETEA